MDQKTFLCITCYFKGAAFLKACKDAGNRVFLVTSENLQTEDWPWESIDETFYMKEDEKGYWNNNDLVNALAYLMRGNKIDRIIALDDFDVERVALIREEFRIPGMGQTTARHFRDKLAMRMKAREGGINVPAFSSLFNDREVQEFVTATPPPWVVKPRSEASATGIRKILSEKELWEHLHQIGDNRHHYLIEQFLPGDVYHVDALSYEGKNVFGRSSKYLNTPFEVAHAGGIFRTVTLEETAKEHKELQALNQELMRVFGMQHGASHSEYIRSYENDQFYFLETSSRVGGAHIAEMIEAASGLNLWKEWARIENCLLSGTPYKLPVPHHKLAAAIISLSRFEYPDDQSFNDPEIWWRMKKKHHIGFILQGTEPARLLDLLEDYGNRIANEFHAAIDAPERSSH
ncbi:MAG: ATP-grasp domain-containing protein [Saprospiraceae bacterium]|nr:ATP-grasp domain-containing protein [Saprospiraceae bacterium]